MLGGVKQMKIRKKRNRLPIQIVETQTRQHSYKKFIWNLGVTALFLMGNLLSFFAVFHEVQLSKVLIIIAALTGMILAVMTEYLLSERPWILILRFFPMVILFFFGPQVCWGGMRLWLNQIIIGWNRLYQKGMVLFAGEAATNSVIAFSILAAMIFGECTWLMIYKRKMVLSWIYGMFWIFVMLIGDCFYAWPAAFLIAALFGASMFAGRVQITKSGIFNFAMILAACMIEAVVASDGKLDVIEHTRENAAHSIHEFRYGKDQLPEGKLDQAYKLQKNNQEMMQITSQDEKNLYIKAYIGSVYENGEWKKIPNSVYGGENAGLLRWLSDKNFDPLKQSAQYYKLSDSKNKIDKNHVKIQINKASRYYFYTSGSLEKITDGNAKENMDMGMLSKGFFGQKKYEWSEISSTKPSELMVADEWVTNPKNTAQKQYSEAEEVYRGFVYDTYTQADKDLIKLMNKTFWEDYNSKSDGIYSALNQVRTKLKQLCTYTKNPDITPEGKDPIEWFLTRSHTGNQMLYASAAVQAFRVHGIPARYVEGYYVGSFINKNHENGKISVTGQNAHAWVEVYFDGIGWQAVDVTPGYYYNVATLQKMVNTPEKIKKNAALKNNGYKGKQTMDSGKHHSNPGKKVKKLVKNMAMLAVGIVTILIIIGVILFAFIEIRFMILERMKAKRYENADMDQKIRILQKEIFGLFTIFGIEVRLGWNTKQTDEILSSQFETIEEGDYERVCELMEKTIYGDITLELFEERTIRTFRNKLVESAENKGWRDKIRFQYRYYKYCC